MTAASDDRSPAETDTARPGAAATTAAQKQAAREERARVAAVKKRTATVTTAQKARARAAAQRQAERAAAVKKKQEQAAQERTAAEKEAAKETAAQVAAAKRKAKLAQARKHKAEAAARAKAEAEARAKAEAEARAEAEALAEAEAEAQAAAEAKAHAEPVAAERDDEREPEHEPEDDADVVTEIFAVADRVAVDEPDAVAEPILAAQPAAPADLLPRPRPVIIPPDADAPLAVEARELTKTYSGSTVLDRVSLSVPAGSFYGLVGPNGAGKTTTLSIISGLLRADGGSVTVAGHSLETEAMAARKAIGVLPDRLRTFDRLTGRQLLYYHGMLRGLTADVVETRASDLAQAFDLTGALGRVVSDYSAGTLKKIMLAGALIHSPRVLILDEPFESVDPASSEAILDVLHAYVSHGGTVMLSSHGIDLVERVCSRIAIIGRGVVLAEGTVDEVRDGLSLAERFTQLSGSGSDLEGLEWLHSFSG